MGSMMLAHINQFTRRLDSTESSFAHGIGLTDKGNNGTVGCFAGVNVQQQHPFYTLDGCTNLFNNIRITSFTEIRDTLY